MAGLYPLSNYQQFDANGELMAGAKLYLYDGGTTTPRVGYKDLALSSAHPNPIVADASGRIPLIYLDTGYYRHRLTTSAGLMVFDQDGLPVLTTSAGGSGTSVDPDSVFKSRDIKIRFDNQPLAGYVRLNGRTIGSAASGATERANIDTQALYEELWGFASIVVPAGKGASAAADFAANKPLTLPNAAGRGLFGVDDMGAGAQSVLTAATITNPTVVGSPGGAQTVTLTQAMLPSYSLTGGSGSVAATGTTDVGTGNHVHTQQGTFASGISNQSLIHSHGYTSNGAATGTATGFTSPGASIWFGASAPQTSTADLTSHAHNVTISGDTAVALHQHTVTVGGSASSVSINSGGSGAVSPNLPPVLLLMIYIRL